MKRIIIHWTAGSYHTNSKILNSYHYVVNKEGGIIPCNHRPEDNENCSDGNYAAHTGGGNTGSIGVAMLGMYIESNRSVATTNYPLTAKQCEACFKFIAELCRKYNIKVTPDTVLTHYEFGIKHPNTASRGKIDIIYLPPYPHLGKTEIGDFIRNKVRWYLQKLA